MEHQLEDFTRIRASDLQVGDQMWIQDWSTDFLWKVTRVHHYQTTVKVMVSDGSHERWLLAKARSEWMVVRGA